MFNLIKKFAYIAMLSIALTTQASEENTMIKNIVLVHGAFVDGSSYRSIIEPLQTKGYQVTSVQNPLTSLEDDVSAVEQVLNRQKGDVVLVGHSWAGMVISQAGQHEKVKKLVYLSAIVPNTQENAAMALERHQALNESLQPDEQGMIWLPNIETYQAVMANDLPLKEVALLFATQPPISAKAFSQKINEPAWKTKPSYYLLTEQDNALPFKVQQSFANMIKAQTKSVAASHLSLISQPQVTVELIEQAAKSKSEKE
ncbi:alpha/beta hydrolase [Rodentibacter trehalosifermentans]|uniref:Alpha/beta hydrolase n=1 Tax=Rodentibacter trehalosifermentans TaxID=1908263 RepID=A0A1V3IYU5_9PAST|nr:alpha/beta hydrolase [Rodentibacter trehalosifermentans]OOF47585.1 alpha/beta hydrolase [Rodentibacter trehalosifermentans]